MGIDWMDGIFIGFKIKLPQLQSEPHLEFVRFGHYLRIQFAGQNALAKPNGFEMRRRRKVLLARFACRVESKSSMAQ